LIIDLLAFQRGLVLQYRCQGPNWVLF